MSEILELSYNYHIDLIKKYLRDNNIEISNIEKENYILFCNYVINKNKSKIKKRSKIRKKLSKLL
jgi:hypothetical protein